MSQPPPAPLAKKSRTPFVIITLVLILAVGGVGFAAFTVLKDDDKKDGSTTEKIDFPDKWDERILPYVKIAAKERDLEFEHPVEVRFLPPAEFEKDFRADEEELTDEDRKEIEQFTGMLRAVGMISGDVDLYKAFNEFHTSGTLAYYSLEDKRITIRGTSITPAVKSTLVHELTHVLQDQHFDIGTRTKELSEDSEDGDVDDNESTVLDAVIEGDASRIETQYRDSLSKKEQKALDDSAADQNEDASETYKKLPKIVVTLETAPYTLGEAVVQAVAEDGGNDAVDDLFTDTPKHEAALLDAFEVITGDTDAEDVDLPDLADGEEKFSSGEFGSLTLFFMLAERVPLKDALAAADGWGGDRYVAYDRDGTACVQIAFAGDTDEDADRIFSTLTAWGKAAPGAPVTVEREDGQVHFTSCDPGKKGPSGKDASQDALTLVASRTYLGITLMNQRASAQVAGCLANSLLREFTIAQLNDDQLAADPKVQAKLRGLAAACR